MKKTIFLNKGCKIILRKAMNIMNLSARSYFRIIKVSRTIADLNESKAIQPEHIKEALSFRLSE